MCFTSKKAVHSQINEATFCISMMKGNNFSGIDKYIRNMLFCDMTISNVIAHFSEQNYVFFLNSSWKTVEIIGRTNWYGKWPMIVFLHFYNVDNLCNINSSSCFKLRLTIYKIDSLNDHDYIAFFYNHTRFSVAIIVFFFYEKCLKRAFCASEVLIKNVINTT